MNRRGFTLIEIVMAVFILMLLLLLAVPSLSGVFADRRLRRSLDSFNDLVRQARERSLVEHRAYLIALEDGRIALRPEAFTKDEPHVAAATLGMNSGESWAFEFPKALTKNPPPEWIFWASGACEPAVVRFRGREGAWAANFSPVTVRAELISYAAK